MSQNYSDIQFRVSTNGELRFSLGEVFVFAFLIDLLYIVKINI